MLSSYTAPLLATTIRRTTLYRSRPHSFDRYGFEDVETVQRCRDDSTWNLRVPVHLLNVLLSLMYKQKLGGYGLAAFRRVVHGSGLLVVLLNGEIP